ncbi:hypothetical protein BKA70DRAFT_1405292 [Coprinopsis sp. MPI-PUGE-AT-0042]|nr:hypothetical protein BKA70DRAFT_1405292 [Coprinopsis sp. MPI-PUGE-AT-0042]
MSLKLVLSGKGRPWNAVYQTESSESMYRVESASKDPKDVTVSRIAGGGHASKHKRLASIRFRTYHSDEITMNGATKKESEIFKHTGVGFHGRDRVWKGPDGQEYRWEMGASKPKLFRNDKNQTLVATFHRQHSGGVLATREKTPASLEIFGGVSEDLLDMILSTFVYMETTRAKRSKETKASAFDLLTSFG